MTPEQSAQAGPTESGIGLLRPEDVKDHHLPVALRGYDKQCVDRFLQRVSEAYLMTWRQAAALRERLGSLEDALASAEGDARSSAKSVAELMQRCATSEDQLTQTVEAHDALGRKLDLSEREHKQALANLREVSERAADLDKQVKAFEAAQRRRRDAVADVAPPPAAEGEAAELLVAAARAAADVRNASRGRALRTLTKARERAIRVHAEAERIVTAIGEERDRMRELLTEALASLDADSSAQPGGLVADLSSRLQETTEPH